LASAISAEFISAALAASTAVSFASLELLISFVNCSDVGSVTALYAAQNECRHIPNLVRRP
jgi:hypothetical protein